MSDEIEDRLREVTPERCSDMWREAFDWWAKGDTFDEAWERVITPKLIVEAVSNSSNVRGYEYDPSTHTLVIEFSGGTKYAYADVSPETFNSRTDWDSAGRWVTEVIKREGYVYERL